MQSQGSSTITHRVLEKRSKGSSVARLMLYAQCAIDDRVCFVNALPVFIASCPVWAATFEKAGVPIVGDDIKSQVGATITHRVLAMLFFFQAEDGIRDA